jgi:hypothetical protein
MHSSELRSLAALRSAQAALVDEVVGSERSRVLVHAPTGSGKTTAALLAANALRARNPDARIAFLLSQRVMSEPVRARLDGLSVDLSAKSDLMTTDPYVRNVNVVIAQQALSSMDVQALLFRTDWDLVVVDEADNLNATGLATVRGLAESTNVQRLLIFSRGFLDLPDPQLIELPISHVHLWHLALEDLSQASLSPVKVHYVRSQPELDLLDRVASILYDLPTSIDPASIDRVKVAEDSTLFALQAEIFGVVDTLRKRRNSLAHATTADPDPNSRPDELLALHRAIAKLEDIVDKIDSVQIEGKVEGLKVAVTDLYKTQAGPIAIFVQPEASARYLGSTLGDIAPKSLALPAEPLVSSELIDEVVRSKGLIVVSDDALSGYDLRNFNVGIHFDYHVPSDVIADRESRIGAIDQRSRLILVALMPTE